MRNGITGGNWFFQRGRRCGFTLIEATIVFSIIGMVTAAIFLAASNARRQTQLNQGLDEISEIVGNMRALYASQNVTAVVANPPTFNAAFEQTLVGQGVFPNEMISGGFAYNPWDQSEASGSAQIAIIGGSSPAQFSLSYFNIPSTVCISLLTLNSQTGTDTGLQKISVNGTAVAVPVTADVAAAACSGAAANTITWVYTLGS